MLQHTKKTVGRVMAAAEAGRSRASKFRRSAGTVAAGALAVVIGYSVMFGHNGLTAYQAKRQDTRDLQRQVDALQKENDRLQVHVQHLQNDPGSIEHEAREELHYTRAGEVIYTLPPEKAAPANIAPAK